MISAGVYGTVDLAKDIRQGTLIQYEKEDAPLVNSLKTGNRNLSHLVNIHTVKAETKKEEKISNPELKLSDLKMEYFSRGEPMYLPELELVNDSVKNSSDTLSVFVEKKEIALPETPKEIVATIEKEERKFSTKLFSRSRPRPYIKKEEIVIAQNDSLKNN